MKKYLIKFSLSLLLLSPILMTNAHCTEVAKYANFKIIISRTSQGIQLQSLGGTAWTTLKFKIANYKPQLVNEYGMSSYESQIVDANRKNSKLANFAFYLTLEQDEIHLKAKEGTHWNTLSFTLPIGKNKTINISGMVN